MNEPLAYLAYCMLKVEEELAKLETIGNFDHERQSGEVLSNGYESIDNMGYVSIQWDHNAKYTNLNYKNAETTNDETPNKEILATPVSRLIWLFLYFLMIVAL